MRREKRASIRWEPPCRLSETVSYVAIHRNSHMSKAAIEIITSVQRRRRWRGGANGGAGNRICGVTMSKPKWARHNGKWGPVKPDFWRLWQNNKDSVKKAGYEVRKNHNGQREIRCIPPTPW